MILYFANRTMNILGTASTELMEGFTISGDLKTEDIDTGVAIFECTVHWTQETRELAKKCTAAGNYLLRSNNYENEFYTIIEVEEDSKDQTAYIYAEDAGMDLLNETVGAFAADQAYSIAYYVEKYARDTGFIIGLNEIANKTRKLEWTGEATAAERIASAATQFDNAEISYSFDVHGLEITNKYINIHEKRGKDSGVQLRLNREVDRIVTTTSVADLATSLYVTGGTPEGEEDPITITGFNYDDGDMYVMADESRLNSRNALAIWSRYVWANEPNQLAGYTGHIVKQYSYDTTSVSELVNRAVSQLKKVCEPAVNYEIDIQQLPENVGIGDYVDLIDEQGELFLQSRILQLQTSVCDQKQTATLGDFLIKEGGISQTIRELAEQFEELAKSRTYYTWIAYADDDEGNGISLDPTDKEYMGTATNRSTPEVDISDPSVFTWVKIQGTSIVEINTYYGMSDSPEVVPTEWTLEPPEWTAEMRNEYMWTYTEYVYSSGLVETTKPTINAYYDYINVDELEAKVANIETLLAGEAGVGELTAINLTAANATIQDGLIVDAMIYSLSADKITAGTIYTNYVKIADDENHSLWIDGATLQMKDDNGTVRIQMGMDASGDYDYYLMDEEENIIWDARGLTEAGLLGNGAIIRDEAVHPEAAIQGSKLDIVSVVESINENGDTVINAGHVEIDGQSLDVWYNSLTNSEDGTLTVMQSQIQSNTEEISLRVSKSEFGDTTSDVWTEIYEGVGNMQLTVGGIETTVDELGNLIDETYATKASLVLELDEETKTATMTAGADIIKITADKNLIIESDRFSLTEDGYITIDNKNFTLDVDGNLEASNATLTNAYVSGTIKSGEGNIGGWTINTDSLYSENDDGNIAMGGGQITVNSTWGATAVFSGGSLTYYYNDVPYGNLGMVNANLTSAGIYTYTTCLYSEKDGVTLGVYRDKSGVTTVYPALSILQGDLYSYYGDNTYRIYLHEAAYAENFTAGRLNASTLSADSVLVDTSGSWHKKADTITRLLQGETPSSLGSSIPSGFCPSSDTWCPIIVSNGSVFYLGGIRLNSGGGLTVRYYPTYAGGTATDITSSSSYLLYGTLTYLC